MCKGTRCTGRSCTFEQGKSDHLNEVHQERDRAAITRRAHIKDAVAVTRFMYWLKKNIGSVPMDEVSVAEQIDGLRAQQDGFIELSFPTISAYGTNGAIIHYGPQKETCAVLKLKGC